MTYKINEIKLKIEGKNIDLIKVKIELKFEKNYFWGKNVLIFLKMRLL